MMGKTKDGRKNNLMPLERKISKWVEWIVLIFVLIAEYGFWALLAPSTYWERAATFGFGVISLVLIILFAHIWRTKWKDD
ncbi:MAG: hypothetical protein ACE1ZQ_00875 [Ignavibacteriaceae bacterium]